MTTIESNKIVIELHFTDLGRAKTFYKKIGFKVVSEEPVGKELGYL